MLWLRGRRGFRCTIDSTRWDRHRRRRRAGGRGGFGGGRGSARALIRYFHFLCGAASEFTVVDALLVRSVRLKGIVSGRSVESPEGWSCASMATLVVEGCTSGMAGGAPSVVIGWVVTAAGSPAGGRSVKLVAMDDA